MKCASQHQHQIPPWMPNLQLRGKTLLQIGRQSLMDLSSLWDNWVKNHSSWRKSWGLLTVQGVLIELSKKSTRVAQVHGSITGKNVLQIIQSVKDRKEKRGTPEKKRLEKSKKIKKEIFFSCCKIEWVCDNDICAVISQQHLSWIKIFWDRCLSIFKSSISSLSCCKLLPLNFSF